MSTEQNPLNDLTVTATPGEEVMSTEQNPLNDLTVTATPGEEVMSTEQNPLNDLTVTATPGEEVSVFSDPQLAKALAEAEGLPTQEYLTEMREFLKKNLANNADIVQVIQAAREHVRIIGGSIVR